MEDVAAFNIADLWESVVDAVPEREALVCGDRRLSFAQLEERANRLAHVLTGEGVGPGDHVGCYLTNSTEYLEVVLACFKLRAVPININYRYTESELAYLLEDSEVVGVVCDESFAGAVATASTLLPPGVDGPRFTLPVGRAYEDALAVASSDRPVVPGRSGDDLYVIYTGGTTGLPKGVVWRHEDAFFGCFGGGDPMRLQGPVSSPKELLDRLVTFEFTFLALAPLMHAAAMWVSFMWLFAGARVVLATGSFDPVGVWRTIESERVSTTTVVGDAMARPLLDAWDTHGPFDVSSMFAFSNGGAPLTPSIKERLHTLLPAVVLTDGFGSSETGVQGSQRLQPGESAGAVTRFSNVSEATAVLGADRRPVEPGSGEVGQVAHSGHLPLRYHRSPERTEASFVEFDGRRWFISGDMATVEADGSIVLLGRGAVCINTGGEKVYPEEVESVLKGHPDVYDVVVVGAPDERFGQAVCAIVQPVPGAEPTLDSLAGHAREVLAGYKLPRRLVVVPQVVRSPSGKADYRWAASIAAEGEGAAAASPADAPST